MASAVDRDYDIVVYGASGFTGKFVVRELYSLATAGLFPNLRWAIAGRSLDKLEQVAQNLAVGDPSVSPPHILLADAGDQPDSENGRLLVEMANSTKVVLNCVGPYRFTGENVVKACLEAGTSYLDLCGEPEFIENMILKYHDAALEKGITIVHAAAFDSVPADLGALFAKRKLVEKGAKPSSVEMFFKLILADGIQPGINYATYQSAVEGFASIDELRKIRKALSAKQPRPTFIGPRPKAPKGLFGKLPPFYDRMGGYLLPYLFADPAIVRQTQVLDLVHTTNEPPIQFGAYIVVPKLWALTLLIFYFLVFEFLVKRAWGRKLLLDNPKLFTRGVVTKQGPSTKIIQGTGFSETFVGRGYSETVDPKSGAKPDVEIITRVTGPELGYVATPILFMFCAKVLLEGKEKVRKGVLTPGVAFGDTDLIEKLNKDGRVTFSVVQA
ncbi:hypothetical protein JAAARDRAFT_189419 [Jaapia argillacea MUCL 33604]|uniref:Saccharopine dehydrogenase NADP binding domain-containing protein n=1 Tax=Jaapia argillacea MUCL 33604 TaxID=933084 RepID=A0A067Q796_9AGAM|nr:hypothetical protein JAAARDRAFT_189419 [Jaapia argillacea MUCL 33604]